MVSVYILITASGPGNYCGLFVILTVFSWSQGYQYYVAFNSILPSYLSYKWGCLTNPEFGTDETYVSRHIKKYI